MTRSTVGALCAKEVSDMRSRSYAATYHQARSFKWVVGVIFILAALYAYLVNHISLFEAATIFGIGVIPGRALRQSLPQISFGPPLFANSLRLSISYPQRRGGCLPGKTRPSPGN